MFVCMLLAYVLLLSHHLMLLAPIDVFNNQCVLIPIELKQARLRYFPICSVHTCYSLLNLVTINSISINSIHRIMANKTDL